MFDKRLAFAWIGIACLVLCIALSLIHRRTPRRSLHVAQLITGGYALLALLSFIGPRAITPLYAIRPNPPLIERDLFEGIHYTREAIKEPVPLVIHILRIDLDSPELRFLVTPPDESEGGQLRAQTTTDFLKRYQLQLAINADGWSPWWDISPLSFYPHRGDPIFVHGFAASEGMIYSAAPGDYATLYISPDNQVSINAPLGEVYNAVTGKNMLVEQGEPHITWNDTNRNPRTVAALDQSGGTLILILVDGRQAGYSLGVTMTELAEIAIRYGAYTAINLDGGGSTTLAIADASGKPILLNAPIHNHMPYWERPIANHLGIYADPLD
jgi:hypothetical protein